MIQINSRAYFEQLAIDNPTQLIELLKNESLKSYELTYAAEIAGKLLSSEMVIQTLISLLAHTSPSVREGVICGLSHHNDPSIIKALRLVYNNDSNSLIRSLAIETINWMEENE